MILAIVYIPFSGDYWESSWMVCYRWKD